MTPQYANSNAQVCTYATLFNNTVLSYDKLPRNTTLTC